MRQMRLLAAVALGALSALQQASADPIFKITEIYVGIDGEDGTPDWIEVTNFGDMAGDTGTLIYDDESLDPTAGGDLPSFQLGPNQSAVFLVEAAESDLALFTSIWGTIPKLGYTTGGGSLGQGGDTAAILLNDGTVVDSLTFPSLPPGAIETVEDRTGMGPIGLSMVGVRGAYESNPFFNDNIGGPDSMISLVGSPGAVPEPSTWAMIAIALASTLAGRIRR